MKKIISVLILFAIFYGCDNTKQLIELRTTGISNYDTVRIYPVKDSLVYPFWRQTIIHYELDSLRTERTYFMIRYIAAGKSDSVLMVRKDTIKRKDN